MNVFPITLPHLRQRREDIVPLVEHYVEVFACRMGKHVDTIPDEFMNALKSYSWRGNIRELQNVIERAVITVERRLAHQSLRSTRSALVVTFPPRTTLRDSERTLILDALENGMDLRWTVWRSRKTGNEAHSANLRG